MKKAEERKREFEKRKEEFERKRKNGEKSPKNNNEIKCDKCGFVGDEYGNFEYLIVDNKTYCNGCADKLPKKSEIEIETLKKDKNLNNSPQKQSELRNKLEKTKFGEKKEQSPSSDNKFPTSLLIVGGVGLVVIIALVGVAVVIKGLKVSGKVKR